MKKLQDELLLNKVGRGPEGWTGGEVRRHGLEGWSRRAWSLAVESALPPLERSAGHTLGHTLT